MIIDITVKTNKNKCFFNSLNGIRVCKGKVTIREQGGSEIEKIMIRQNILNAPPSEEIEVAFLNRIDLRGISSLPRLVNREQGLDDIFFLEIILAWNFKDKGSDEDFDLTFQNINYESNDKPLEPSKNIREEKGLCLSNLSWKPKAFDLWSAVDLGTAQAVIKNQLNDFIDLAKKSKHIKNKIDDFSFEQFISHLSNFEKYLQPENQALYELEVFFKTDNNPNPSSNKLVKGFIEKELEWCQKLKLWKSKNIPNLSLKIVGQAQKNEFCTISDINEISSQGFYKGFSVFRTEQRKIKSDFGFSFQNCYTKTNIDLFRQLFPNNLDQSDPKYFRGFQPGDLVKDQEGDILYLSEKAVRDNLVNLYKINSNLPFQTKTYLDLLEARKLNEFLEILCSNPTAYSEVVKANKSQHLENYQAAIKKNVEENNPFASNSQEKTFLDNFCSQLRDFFLVLDKNYSAESRVTCQKDLKLLEDFKEDLNGWGKKIVIRFQSETNTKKIEIQQRIISFNSPSLNDQIRAAAGESYGKTKKRALSPEQTKIFTTHATKIDSLEVLDKIKDLLNVLIFAEEEKLNSNDNQAINSLLEDLKNRWKNGDGSFKKAYEIVNKVDNQWVIRLISKLESQISNENDSPNSGKKWIIGLIISGFLLTIGILFYYLARKKWKKQIK